MAALVKTLARPVYAGARSFSVRSAAMVPWNLFPLERPVVAEPPVAPRYLMNVHETLEFSLERMRLMEQPITMQLLNRNARRPKKANHGKRPCSHHRRRQKRLGRRS